MKTHSEISWGGFCVVYNSFTKLLAILNDYLIAFTKNIGTGI